MKTIQPATRLDSVQEYYFSRKLKEIAELNRQGKDIISLGIGSPDMPPSEQTIQALCNEAKKSNVHGYQSYTGLPELRKKWADWYQKWFDVKLDPTTEIQPLIGSKEGILHISMAFLNAGDGVLVPNPGYPTYSSIGHLLQSNVISYDLDENKNWLPDFDALEKKDLSRVKLMWINYPNMPTGASASLELFKKIVDFSRKHQIVVVNDNPYSFILNEKQLSLLQIEKAKETCIEMNSMSKSHNMAGWRIGMLASNEQFVKWILKVKSNVDSGTFRPLQTAAVEALNNSETWHRQMNIEIYKKRRILAEKIMSLLGCEFDKNQVGMFLWGKIPNKYTDSATLADKVLYESRVFVTPGFIFGSNGQRYIRISLCANEDLLQQACRRIKETFSNN